MYDVYVFPAEKPVTGGPNVAGCYGKNAAGGVHDKCQRGGGGFLFVKYFLRLRRRRILSLRFSLAVPHHSGTNMLCRLGEYWRDLWFEFIN